MENVHFAARLPDEFTKCMRPYILDLINGLSGGEFEQNIKATMIFLLSGQKELSKKKYEELKIVIPQDNIEVQTMLHQDSQIGKLRPSFQKKNKLPGMLLTPGSKAHKKKYGLPLRTINRLSPPQVIMDTVAKAFPHNSYVNFWGKQESAQYTEGALTIVIAVYKTTVTYSKQDPQVLRYLAWLPKNDFVEQYLGKTIHTVYSNTLTFSMQMDPRVAERPAHRVADEIAEGPPTHYYEKADFKVYPVFKAHYEQEVLNFKREMHLLEELNMKLERLSKRKSSDPKPSIYPKEIPFENFDWEAKDFRCPICWEEKRNKHMAVWGCFHVSCDSCNRISGTQQCSLCKQ